MKQFTDITEAILKKSDDKVKGLVDDIKTQELMSKLTTWMSVLWKNCGGHKPGKLDILGREIKYGDVVVVHDMKNLDCSFGIVIDHTPDKAGNWRVFQWGAEDWDMEDPWEDTMYATTQSENITILARKEDGYDMIWKLMKVKK